MFFQLLFIGPTVGQKLLEIFNTVNYINLNKSKVNIFFLEEQTQLCHMKYDVLFM